uniref:Uncharacterized protein n=1 Tax=Panagrolaimus sp. ES5 TaxID=591445 RepID=A0AC34GCF4_9BILA
MAAQRAAAVAAMGFQAGNPLAAAAAANWMLNGNTNNSNNNNFGKTSSKDNEVEVKAGAVKTELPSKKEVNDEKTLASPEEMLSPNNLASTLTAKFFNNTNTPNQVAQALIAHFQQQKAQ